MYIIDHASLTSSKDEKCFRKKVVEKIKTYILRSKPFSDKRAVYGKSDPVTGPLWPRGWVEV